MHQHAHIRRRAPHVDDHSVPDAAQECRSPHRVGGARGECGHRVAASKVGAHQGAVVLADVQRAVEAKLDQRPDQPGHGALGERSQARIHDRSVLTLEQPQPADLTGQADVEFRCLAGQDITGLGLEAVVDGREDRGHRHRAHALRDDVLRRCSQLVVIDGADQPTVELMAAVAEIDVVAEHGPQPLGPVDERRQSPRGGEPEPHDGSGHEAASLHQGVGEVRRADHDRTDRFGRRAAVVEHGPDSGHDAVGHLRCRDSLGPPHHLAAGHGDRVGVGAAHVHTDPQPSRRRRPR